MSDVALVSSPPETATVLEVTVTARQALAIGQRPTADAPVHSHLHIPGSVLRGALAATWITQYGEPDPVRPGRGNVPAARKPEFIGVFERGVRFGPLFMTGSVIVPLSVVQCKYAPERDCRDMLFDEAFAPVPKRCPVCDGPLVQGRGDVGFFGRGDVQTEKTRLALSDGETAQEGLLFTRRALRPRDGEGRRLAFSGQIIVPGGAGDTEWLHGPHRIYVGGRRSTGGAADYQANPIASPGTGSPFSDPASIADAPSSADSADGDRLVIRLLSPAILVDRAGRPSDRPDLGLVAELLGVPVRPSTRAWTRMTTVGGWHAASNLPKSDELAVSAGSVFELSLAETPSAEGITRLLRHGLGLRRGEGYGWIEAGPWQSPAAPAPADPSADLVGETGVTGETGFTGGDRPAEPDAARVADLLFASEHGHWLRKELIGFLARFGGDERPDHSYLLSRPQLERALRDEHFREALEGVLREFPPGKIMRIIKDIEARNRGTAS